jgi:hypothetical protein
MLAARAERHAIAQRARRAALRAPMPQRVEPDAFRSVRLWVGLTQPELAEMLQTRQATISNRERLPCGANTRRTWCAWEQTCHALGLDPVPTLAMLAPLAPVADVG